MHRILGVPPVSSPAETRISPHLHEPLRHVCHQLPVRSIRVLRVINVDGDPDGVSRHLIFTTDRPRSKRARQGDGIDTTGSRLGREAGGYPLECRKCRTVDQHSLASAEWHSPQNQLCPHLRNGSTKVGAEWTENLLRVTQVSHPRDIRGLGIRSRARRRLREVFPPGRGVRTLGRRGNRPHTH